MVRLNGPPVVPKELYNKVFVMLCTFGINEGKFERVYELLVANTRHARDKEQPGTVSYRWYHTVDKKTVVVYEEYANIEGYNIHARAPTGSVFGKALMTEDLFSSIDVEFMTEIIE